jgi:hypothetical protein
MIDNEGVLNEDSVKSLREMTGNFQSMFGALPLMTTVRWSRFLLNLVQGKLVLIGPFARLPLVGVRDPFKTHLA